MVTFADLIADVETDVYSFTADVDQTATLTNPVAVGDLVFQVDDASQVRDGFIEITSTSGNELIFVQSTDETANTVTTPAWGRGQRGSIELAHPTDSRVVSNPSFPRGRIQQVINELLADLYPEIFAVDHYDQPTFSGTWSYSLPRECVGLVDVLLMDEARPEHGWQPLRRMRYDATSNTITVGETPCGSFTMRVVYRKGIGTMSALTDTLADVSLDDSYRALVRAGALYKILSSLTVQRLTISSVEAAVNTQLRQPDYMNNAIKTAYSQYQLKLADKRADILLRYPPLRYKTF